MSFLVTVLLFGVVGAILLCALVGLTLPRMMRSGRRGRIALAAGPLAVLLLVPTFAALGVMGAPGAGFGTAFLAAFAVLAMCYTASALLVPLLARPAATGTSTGTSIGAGLASPATVLGAGLGCAVLAAATAGLAMLLAG